MSLNKRFSDFVITKKRIKNINFRVRQGCVYISAPLGCNDEYLERIIALKEPWLREVAVKQQAKLSAQTKLANSLNEANLISFLGEIKRLDEIDFIAVRKAAYLLAKSIYEDVYHYDLAQPLDASLKAKLAHELHIICTLLASAWAKRLGVSFNALKISRARRTWGSCKKSTKELKFSLQLITQPLNCINYVALHECAHLIHANHSAAFWAVISKHMNDYKTICKQLKTPVDSWL